MLEKIDSTAISKYMYRDPFRYCLHKIQEGNGNMKLSKVYIRVTTHGAHQWRCTFVKTSLTRQEKKPK